MEKSNITNKIHEQNALAKIQKQLNHVQQIAGEVEQRVAESRAILRSYVRKDGKDGAAGYDGLNDMVLEAAKNSEYLTERLRRLTLELTLDQRKYVEYKRELVTIHGIEAEYAEGILRIDLPVLIPHRKAAYTDFLCKPLYTALQHWCVKQAEQSKEIPFFEYATVAFVHEYDRTLPLARVRDHDNMEEKQILDVIDNFFLKSDNGKYINTYHEITLAETDRTHIYVMRREDFPLWLMEKKTGLRYRKKTLVDEKNFDKYEQGKNSRIREEK